MGHAFRFAKTVLVIILLVGFLGLGIGLAYLNKVGFPGQYGDWLTSELAERGLHLTFDTLRFDLKRGVVATNVAFFAEAGDGSPLLRADDVVLDLDKTKALRGKFRLLSLEVHDGTADIPIDENGRTVEADRINGTLLLTDSNRARIDRASGMIEGIRVTLSSNLRIPKIIDPDKPRDPARINRILATILDELALWTLESDHPPEISFSIRGDLSQPDQIATGFTLEARDISRNSYQLRNLRIAGDFKRQLVTFDEILLEDASGLAKGKADWNVLRREGRFDLTSTLQLQLFLKSCFGITVVEDLELAESPTIDARGTFAAPPGAPFSVKAVGTAEVGSFEFLSTAYDGLSSQFSWHDGDLYLRSLEVRHRQGQLDGDIIAINNLVRYDLDSTLPLEAIRPFIKPDGGLEKAIARLDFHENSTLVLTAAGSLDRDDLTEWAASGKVHLKDFNYRGTDFHHMSCDFDFIPGEARFSRLTAQLDDDGEAARQRFGSEGSGQAFADEIDYDTSSRVTTIKNLRGELWPSPIVRMFSPKTADHLEKNYRFHQPPTVVVNGTFAGRPNEPGNTRFTVALNAGGRTDYTFLGKSLTLGAVTADIAVTGYQVSIQNLSFATLGGTVSGAISINADPEGRSGYRGALKWDELSFPQISSIYQFKEEEPGALTGSVDFRGSKLGIRDFNADGLVGIRQGQLVSLPVLGPLSPLIAGVLGDKRVGYENAKDASATFAVRRGVMQTPDFVAVSKSITLTGEGWLDLATKKMDMTVRLNAQGLLGLLTLPLQPIKGIFQFRGTGIYTKPKWRSSPFTRPTRGPTDPIFRKPGRARPVAE